MAIFSAIIGIWSFGHFFHMGGENNIFTQISLFVLAGLACKNAILIVEFAIEEEGRGKSIHDAIMSAVRMRFRPVLMTSLTFVFGMLPLLLSSGAGSASRAAVGTGVVGGMLAATVFGLFYIPLFYLSVRRWLSKRRPPSRHHEEADDTASDNDAR
jgi:multidrug efflux pump